MTPRSSAPRWLRVADFRAQSLMGEDLTVIREQATVTGADASLLRRARDGDQAAFAELVGPYRRELNLHCYRMLGSFHDAEDVLQEALVRAWRCLDKFEARGSVRSWLYRIATNRCLTARTRVASTPLPGLQTGPQPPPPNATDVRVTALQPYPDAWLNHSGQRNSPTGVGNTVDPAARYEERESVQLAFLTVIQLLPGKQRAVLLLRDVLAFSTPETAQILETTETSVNSALQRARAALDAHRAAGRLRDVARSPESSAERLLLEQFIAAWHRRDIPGLVALMATDALLTMPPEPLAYRGRAAISAFLGTVPAGGDLTAIRLVPTRMNGQPAVAAYLREGATALGYGIMVLNIERDKIGEITGFADPALFPLFGLATRIDW